MRVTWRAVYCQGPLKQYAGPATPDLYIFPGFPASDQAVLDQGIGVVPEIVVPAKTGFGFRQRVGHVAQLFDVLGDLICDHELPGRIPVDIQGAPATVPEIPVSVQEVEVVERGVVIVSLQVVSGTLNVADILALEESRRDLDQQAARAATEKFVDDLGEMHCVKAPERYFGSKQQVGVRHRYLASGGIFPPRIPMRCGEVPDNPCRG